jgi:4'-phosphopantetheinyl transferase
MRRASPTAVLVRWLALDPAAVSQMDALAALLDVGERERAGRFHFDRDRHAYIAAHALARTLLAIELGRPPSALRFAVNAFGKPELARGMDGPPLRFNLSHTKGLVAVAVTHTHDVGIDVEAIDPARLSLDLALSTFAAAEVALLHATPEAGIPEALYAIWTLKEACIKALGQGLSFPLEAFAVTLDPLGVEFSVPPGEVPGQWLLWRLKPMPTHVLALALPHPDPTAVHIDASGIAAEELLRLAGQVALPAGQMSRK